MSRTKKLDPARISKLIHDVMLLPLIDRVNVARELKLSIDAEVKEKQEAAKEAEQIANGK